MSRLVLLLALMLPLLVQAIPPLPEVVSAKLPGLRPAGEGRFRWLGLHIYDAALWFRGGAPDPGSEFALDIRYARNIPAQRLVATTSEEMRRLGFADDGRHTVWLNAMSRVFPDIAKGDRLTGVNIPHRGVEFYYNGRFVGEIADVQFARAFFSIWLDPRTRAPRLRESLIGRN